MKKLMIAAGFVLLFSAIASAQSNAPGLMDPNPALPFEPGGASVIELKNWRDTTFPAHPFTPDWTYEPPSAGTNLGREDLRLGWVFVGDLAVGIWEIIEQLQRLPDLEERISALETEVSEIKGMVSVLISQSTQGD